MYRNLFVILSLLACHALAVTNTNTVVTARTASEAYVANRIGAALAPVAASVTNLSTTLSTTTGTVAIIANQVTNLSQSVASVESVLSTNQWIGIDSVPASASRVMIAPNVFKTIDTNGVADIWGITWAWRFDGSSNNEPIPYPLSAYEDETWRINMASETNVESIAWGVFKDWNTQGVVEYDSKEFVVQNMFIGESKLITYQPFTTNHLARIASTNDINTAIAAWMASDAAGQWVAGAATSAASGLVANHANSPTHLITGDRALIDSISGKVSVADKEFHADSYTNLVWRSVFSNGWVWLQAYTNTP